MEKLEPEKLYAVEYKYGKESPFSYSESKRFIVETPKVNGLMWSNILTHHNINEKNKNITLIYKQWPIKLIIQNINKKKIFAKPATINTKLSKINGTLFVENSTINQIEDKNKKDDSPYIIMQLHPNFLNFEVGIDIEPFCELDHNIYSNSSMRKNAYDNVIIENMLKNNTRKDQTNNHKSINYSKYFFWLNHDRPYQILRHLDVLSAICFSDPLNMLCKNFKNTINQNKYRLKKCKNGALLCYTPIIHLKKKLFTMDRYCINLVNYLSSEILKNQLLEKVANETENMINFTTTLRYSKLVLFFFLIIITLQHFQ